MDKYSCEMFDITYGTETVRVTMGGSECDCQDTCDCSTSECDSY